MSTQTLKLIKTDSQFLEAAGHMVQGDEEGKDWYYLPHWYQKIGDGLYVETPFQDLPQEVKNIILDHRKEIPELMPDIRTKPNP